MDLDDGVTLRAGDDPTIKNELRRAWIADRLDERLGEFGETHAVDVVCATWNANGKDVTKLNLDLEPWLRSWAAPADVRLRLRVGVAARGPDEVVADDGGDAPRVRCARYVPPRWRAGRARARLRGGAVSTDE